MRKLAAGGMDQRILVPAILDLISCFLFVSSRVIQATKSLIYLSLLGLIVLRFGSIDQHVETSNISEPHHRSPKLDPQTPLQNSAPAPHSTTTKPQVQAKSKWNTSTIPEQLNKFLRVTPDFIKRTIQQFQTIKYDKYQNLNPQDSEYCPYNLYQQHQHDYSRIKPLLNSIRRDKFLINLSPYGPNNQLRA